MNSLLPVCEICHQTIQKHELNKAAQRAETWVVHRQTGGGSLKDPKYLNRWAHDYCVSSRAGMHGQRHFVL
jgi:hypothetical protein